MKTIISTFLMILVANVSMQALSAPKDNATHDAIGAYWNPVTIKNNTPYDIAYTMHSRAYFGDRIYGIKKGMSDVYHAGKGDTNATLLVSVCSHMRGTGSRCSKTEPLTMTNCFNGVHYNAEMIRTIQVNSLKSCEVTCIDGSKTSCVNDLFW